MAQNDAAQAVLRLKALYLEWLTSIPEFSVYADRVKADLAAIDDYVGGPQ